MAITLFEMWLQEIRVVVFSLVWIFVLMNTTTMIPPAGMFYMYVKVISSQEFLRIFMNGRSLLIKYAIILISFIYAPFHI